MAQDDPSSAEQDAAGTMFSAAQFGGVILSSALYGIQFFMALSSLSAFLRRSKDARKGHFRYIVASCVILIATTVELALRVMRTFLVLFTGGPEPLSYIYALLKDAEKNRTLIYAGDAMIGVSVAVGDALLLWRCFVLWSHKKWVVLLPSLTCLGAIGSFILCFIFGLHISGFATAAIAASSLSVSTNVMVTLLILLRLKMTWAHTSEAFPDRKTPRMYLAVAGVLIEAATPLSALGICFIVTTALTAWYPPEEFLEEGRLLVRYEIFMWLYYASCYLSPQMIIYRVAAGRSWKDATDSQKGGANISQPIQFARGAVREYEGGEMSSAYPAAQVGGQARPDLNFGSPTDFLKRAIARKTHSLTKNRGWSPDPV
ncbi:hypothetical protein BKA70DRAFT_1559723 [Coprinopsis sp. MPI-PUGE-AT-0042]|nr:hypothetical protein BKA70DRAFT_1559723 [Coprinopsis sp. MPI-PUGE-AT-0042]